MQLPLLHFSSPRCVMQLLLLSHLQLSSISPLRDAASSPLSSDLHCVMQLPALLCSSPLLRSPLRDAASYPPPSSAALLSSPQSLLRSPLHDAASFHLQLSVSPLPYLSPPLLSTAWCSFLSSLSCSSPILHLSSSTEWCSFLSSLSSAALLHLSSARCSFLSSSLICSSPLLHLSSPPSNSYVALLLWSPLRDAASCPPPSSAALLGSFSPLLHLTPLLLSSDLHCVMQLPLFLPHLQLSSPPSNSSAALLLRGLSY